jgi:hypothetical protein
VAFDKNQIRDYWAKKRAEMAEAVYGGGVIITSLKGKIQVAAPYSEQFVERANQMGGHYRPKTKRWSFKLGQLPFVVTTCREVFGKGKVSVRIRGYSLKENRIV